MARVAIFLAFASVLFAALALISCLSVENEEEIRGLPRFAWVIVIIIAPIAGSLAWFLAGRPKRPGPAGGWRVAGGFPEPPRPKAPDDDPDFLRSIEINQGQSAEDEELLRLWEEDLRRREEEQRRRDTEAEG